MNNQQNFLGILECGFCGGVKKTNDSSKEASHINKSIYQKNDNFNKTSNFIMNINNTNNKDKDNTNDNNSKNNYLIQRRGTNVLFNTNVKKESKNELDMIRNNMKKSSIKIEKNDKNNNNSNINKENKK